jgi:hypothetical protein
MDIHESSFDLRCINTFRGNPDAHEMLHILGIREQLAIHRPESCHL